MVLLVSKKDFHAETMTQLGELRQAGSLCDVTLTVGQDQIQAHRCVLAARSEYFRTAFLGRFKEASMQNINLSEVTRDVTDLEQVVDFMYSGKIEINDDNFEVLVKLSTYLLMKSLKENCLKYLENHTSLKTCLNHYMYFYCVDHCLDETKKKLKLILMSRFHDYFIYEDNLNLTPDEVQILLNKGMFKHCTASDIVQFVFRWLTNETTDEHISIASQILDVVDKEIAHSLSEQQKCEIKETLAKIEEKFHYNQSSDVKMFLQKVQKISMEAFSKFETDRKSCLAKSEPSSANVESQRSEYEEVIVTLSPKQCVVDEYHEFMELSYGYQFLKEPTFTLCCYVPSTKAWYHIKDFTNDEPTTELPKPRCEKSYTFISFLYEGKLGLISDYYSGGFRVYFHHFSGVWERTILPEIGEESEEERVEVNACCLINGNGCLYLIVKMVLGDKRYQYVDCEPSFEPKEEYFMGFRLGGDDCLIQKIFQTSMCSSGVCVDSELQAKFSSESNELIFTCGQMFCSKRDFNSEDWYSYVFIVNLNDEDPVALDLTKKLDEGQEEILRGHKILQTETHFYIVYDGTADSRYRDVRILYEYEFQSLRLAKPRYETNRQDDSTTLSDEAKPGDETEKGIRINKLVGNEEDMFPCCEEITVSNGKSLWSFEGDRHYFSGLHEVQVKEDGSLQYKEHTPPPFSCVTRIAVGELPADLVAKWTPIKKFLNRTDSV